MTFTPGLRYRQHIEGIQRGRGPSATNLTADLSGCTDASNGPAPGGIDHGTLQGTGKVSGSYCEKLDRLKLTTDVVWESAGNVGIGRTTVKLAVDVAMLNFNDPAGDSVSPAGPRGVRWCSRRTRSPSRW